MIAGLSGGWNCWISELRSNEIDIEGEGPLERAWLPALATWAREGHGIRIYTIEISMSNALGRMNALSTF